MVRKILTPDVTPQQIRRSFMQINEVMTDISGEDYRLRIDDYSGAALTPGVKGFFTMRAAGRLSSITVLADRVGSIVLDLWKTTYALYPGSVVNSICGGNKPTISGAQKDQDTTLTNWTTIVARSDVIMVNVDSAATIRWVDVTLTLDKS